MQGWSLEQQKAYWQAFERERPKDIATPLPGQESVWDYPRPPRIEPVQGRLRVEFAGITIADTTRAVRVIETSGAPVYYFPQEDVKRAFLHPMRHSTLCEWKGLAAYWTLSVRGLESPAATWSYPEPDPGYEELAGRFAFYAGRVDACYVNDERVQPQPSDFYGGWVTSKVVGPFKGAPGTERW